MKWVTSTTVAPCPRTSRIAPHTPLRARGSRPWVPSSKNTAWGWLSSARGNEQPLALPSGQRRKARSTQPAEFRGLEQLIGRPVDLRHRTAGRLPRPAAGQEAVPEAGCPPEPAAPTPGGTRVHAQDTHAAAVGAAQALEAFHGGGLARPVDPHEAEDLAFGHRRTRRRRRPGASRSVSSAPPPRSPQSPVGSLAVAGRQGPDHGTHARPSRRDGLADLLSRSHPGGHDARGSVLHSSGAAAGCGMTTAILGFR